MCSLLLLLIFYCQCCWRGFVYIGKIYRFCPGQSGFMRLQQQWTLFLFCVLDSSCFQHHWKMDSSLSRFTVNIASVVLPPSLCVCMCVRVVSQDKRLGCNLDSIYLILIISCLYIIYHTIYTIYCNIIKQIENGAVFCGLHTFNK